MKNYTFKLLMLVYVIAIPGIMSAQYDLKKSFSNEFTITSSSNLLINTQFSELEVLNWEKNIIKTDVNISVSGSDRRRSEELLKSIEVMVSQEGQDVLIKTILPDMPGNRMATKFEIKITVHTPSNINLELDNKYGAAFIENIDGLATLNSSYGALNVQNLTRGNTLPLNQLNIKYGAASIETVNWLNTSVAYSKLNIEEATLLTVNSKYSGINIDRCNSLASEAKYDTYKLGEIDHFTGILKYGNINMSVLNKDFDLSADYSNVKIMEVAGNFDRIKLDTRNGGCKILINPAASYTFRGEASSGSINVESLSVTHQLRENSDLLLEGIYGKSGDGQIDVNVKNGSVKIGLL